MLHRNFSIKIGLLMNFFNNFNFSFLALTSSTKTIPTTSVAKTTSVKTGTPASNRRRGPHGTHQLIIIIINNNK